MFQLPSIIDAEPLTMIERDLYDCLMSMSNQQITPLATYVDRARKVLQFEQRTNHQDRAIKPGGLEAFIARWYDETSAICKNTGLDLGPIHRFVEHFEGYHQQDPMLRAASLRAALAILNELDGDNHQHTMPTSVQTAQTTSNGHAKQSSIAPAATHAVSPAEPAKRDIAKPQPIPSSPHP